MEICENRVMKAKIQSKLKFCTDLYEECVDWTALGLIRTLSDWVLSHADGVHWSLESREDLKVSKLAIRVRFVFRYAYCIW